MNKQELIESVAEVSNINKKEATNVVNTTLDIISDALVKGDKVQLLGFGTFEVRKRAEKTGRNPKTGEVITIPESKSIGFKAGKALKDAVN